MYFEIYKDVKGEYRQRSRAANHEVITQSEDYASKQSCQHAADLLRSTTVVTPIREV